MNDVKASGVQWIGNIPSNWNLYKMKHLGNYINGYAFKPDDWSATGLPIIRIQDLTGSNDNPNYYEGQIPEKYHVYDGDILVSWAATLSAFIWNKGEGWLNQHIFKAIPNYKITDYDYFLWLLKTAMTYMNDDNKHGIMMQHVTLPVFNNFIVPVPPLKEQAAIAAIISNKVCQIDSLIDNVQTQIEKLKVYKKTAITEVVTKGLDRSVSMKNSGIEWLGDIPKHWNIERGKRLFIESDLRSSDGSEELLTVSQYTGVTPRSEKNVNMFEALSLEGYKICQIGDIAANTMWMWAGAIGVSQYHGVISPSYNVYHPIGEAYYPQYLDYLLRIPSLVQCYESQSTGIRASRLRLYPQQFLNIKFPIPPYEEQVAMASELKKRCEKVDQLIAIKLKKIDKLNQYKKTIIYEYVTGKKEVACD